MLNIKNIHKLSSVCANSVRYACRYNIKHNKSKLYKQSESLLVEKYIRYYPRSKDSKLEDFKLADAPKLFRVHRIKAIEGNPFWEKRILRDFGLFEKGAVAIVKNIPENNQRLMKIKHLIRIEPISFPYGEPTKEDLNYSFLKENGECVVIKKLNAGELERRLEATKQFENDEKQLDGEVLKRDTRLKWLNHY